MMDGAGSRTPQTPPGDERSPFSGRVLVTGALLCLLIAVGTPYSNLYLQGSLLAIDFGTAAALFLLFLLLWINAGVRAAFGRRLFSSHQLAVLYAMMATACAIPTMGLMEYLLPGTTALEYYGTPENGWHEAIQPYVKEWLVVGDPLAVKYFYEGLPSGVTYKVTPPPKDKPDKYQVAIEGAKDLVESRQSVRIIAFARNQAIVYELPLAILEKP